MPFDFPNSPTTGQIVSGPNGVYWSWDGTKWVVLASGSAAPVAPNQPYGDNDTSVANTAFVQSAVTPVGNNIGRNFVHNPFFNIWQRGTGPWTVSGNYTADRWTIVLNLDTDSVSRVGAGVVTVDESITYLLGNTFTGNAGAGAYSILMHGIENVRRLSATTVTVSFYASCTAGTKKLGVSLDQFFGTGGSPSASVNGTGQSVTINTTFQRYSVTLAVPSISGKTLGTDGNDKTTLAFWYSAGSSFDTRSGSVGVQSGTVYISGVQLELGTQATPLERVDPADDLRRCQRFYQVTHIRWGGFVTSGWTYVAMANFAVTMRAAPTCAITSDSSGSMGARTIGTNDIYCVAVQAVASATSGGSIEAIVTASADL